MNHLTKVLTSLDTYRDGGSLSASFKREDGKEFTLFFQVNVLALGKSNGYQTPTLQEHIRVERISPVTGIASYDSRTETQSITWEQASSILAELAPQVANTESDYQWVLQAMSEAAANQGCVS